ncbi:MAG: ABC transporter permease [Clostridia bacterium]|nr:ABC transporter permease [Clostridia bacterium]
MKKYLCLILSLILFLSSLISYAVVKAKAQLPTAFGKDYAIIRVFDKDGINNNEISNIRFTAEGLSEADAEDDGRLWCDAGSYFTQVSVSRPDRTAINCNAVVTEGDFFLFHDLDFKSGWYYNETDLHLDRVVIDEKLAFELFGSNDVEDMKLNIGIKTLYVSGVVAYDESEAKIQQLGDLPVIYIPQRIAVGIFGERPFDSYEIMMQNPVDSYAVNGLTSVTEGKEVVDVTARFELKKIFSLLKEFPTRSYRSEAVSYPYWENAERGVEDILTLLLAVNLVTLTGFVISLAVFIAERKKR